MLQRYSSTIWGGLFKEYEELLGDFMGLAFISGRMYGVEKQISSPYSHNSIPSLVTKRP